MVENHHHHVLQPQPQPQPLHNNEDCRKTRIMARFKASLVSYDSSLSSSFVQRRLEQLFVSFDTPTHPPYALMIRRAIMELNEGTGSTEETICEFIRREYKDLPLAHVKILGLHLKKLCQVGELDCNEDGRYMLLGDSGGRNCDEEEKEQCNKGGKKRKEGKKRRNNCGDGERKGTVESNEEGVEIEKCNGLMQKEEGIIREQIQECDDEPCRKGDRTQEKGERECKHSIGRVEERIEGVKRRSKVVPKQSQHKEVEASAPNGSHVSQTQDSLPHTETVFSSQPTALNTHVDSQQSFLVSTSEGFPKCKQQKGMGSSPTQLHQQMSCDKPSESNLDATTKNKASLSCLNVQEHKHEEKPMSKDPEPNHKCKITNRKSKQNEEQGESLLSLGDDANAIPQKPNAKQIDDVKQTSSNIDLGKVSITKASLTSVNVNVDDDKQPQHYIKGNQNENPISEKKPQKRPRGRPPKLETVANHTGESLWSSDNKQNPNIYNIEKKHKYGKGRGRGRPRKAKQCEEPMQQEDQAQQHGQVRGRGRPRKLNQNTEQCGEKLQQENQCKQHGRGRGRGTGRGRGRPPKLNRNIYKCEEPLQSQDKEQGLVSSPNSGEKDTRATSC